MSMDPERERVTLPDDAVEGLARALRPALESTPVITAAYLYGSTARREPAGDIDLGLLVRRPLTLAERGALTRRLEDASPFALPVDARELSDEDVLFNMEVLSQGTLIYERDPAARVSFEATVFSRYPDEAVRVERLREAFARRTWG